MDIKYLGKNGVWLMGKKEKMLINPEKEILTGTKTSGRVLAYTNARYDGVESFDGERVILRGPGEYEIGGVEVLGVNGGDGNTIYVVEMDGVRLGYLDKLSEKLSDKRIEKVDELDVLIVSTKEPEALKLAKKWGVNYVVPVDFEVGDENIKKFLNEADEEGIEAVESLKIDKNELPEGMEVVLLCPIK